MRLQQIYQGGMMADENYIKSISYFYIQSKREGSTYREKDRLYYFFANNTESILICFLGNWLREVVYVVVGVVKLGSKII